MEQHIINWLRAVVAFDDEVTRREEEITERVLREGKCIGWHRDAILDEAFEGVEFPLPPEGLASVLNPEIEPEEAREFLKAHGL